MGFISWIFGFKNTINQSYTTTDNIVNSKITINGKSIVTNSENTLKIDGIEIKIKELDKSLTIIVNGDVNSITNGVGDFQINGNVSSLTSSVGDVTIEGFVNGNVKNSTGDIRINGNVSGDIKTSLGDIKIKK